MPLPIYRLNDCHYCGHSGQGTRAKGGNSVRCVGTDADGYRCDVMRRVPLDRPTCGPDDPYAVLPARGRPFEPGNVYRMRPGEQPGAPRRRSASSSSAPQQRHQAPAATARQAAPRPQTVPAQATMPQLDRYRACGLCSEANNLTGPGGTWPAAVAELELWGENNQYRSLYVCTSHYQGVMSQAPGQQVRVYSQGKRIA